MSLHPMLQIKILGIAFLCEVALMTYVAPQWSGLMSLVISFARPLANPLAGW